MKQKPKLSSGQHRAQSPARASNTMITAMLIVSFSIAAVLIITVIILAGEPRKAIQISPRAVARSSSPASPLGGGTAPTAAPATYSPEVTTHILHDEPLEGGGGIDEPVRTRESKVTSATSPTAPRERPAIEAMQTAVVEAQLARERRIAVWRIDTYLAHKNSPMQGCGEFYIQNQERTGIPGALSAGIAEAESTNGMRTYNSHTKACPGESYNAWGMISSRFYGGFGSWKNGIRANFDWLMEWHSHGGTQPPQTIHDCSGYCEGNTTNQTVDDVQWQINAYEPPEGL